MIKDYNILMTTSVQSFYSPDPAVIVACPNPGTRRQVAEPRRSFIKSR